MLFLLLLNITITIIYNNTYIYNLCIAFLQTVTFQCILASNGTRSFVLFLYSDGEINQRVYYDDYYGDYCGDYYYPVTAQVGLNAGNQGDFLTVKCSLTVSIYNIDENSNVNEPGKFVFQVNGVVRGEPGSGMECGGEKQVYIHVIYTFAYLYLYT